MLLRTDMTVHALTEEPTALPSDVRSTVLACATALPTPQCVTTANPALLEMLHPAVAGSAKVCISLLAETAQVEAPCDRSAIDTVTLLSTAAALEADLTLLDAAAVSYTHLTLPTTPYV